jgi:hypothetical protein
MPSFRHLVIYMIFFSACLFSCRNKNFKEQDATFKLKLIKLPVQKSKKIFTISGVKNLLNITKLDSSQLVAEISKLLIVDEKMFILDVRSKTLFCFDKNGFFLWKYNKVGKGPQEHAALVDFSVRGNQIYLLDILNKLLKIDINGKFIESKRISIRDPALFANLIFVDDDKKPIIYSNDLGSKDDVPYKLNALDTTLSTIEAVYLLKRHSKGDVGWLPSAFPMQPFTDNTGFFYTEALNDTIYTYKSHSLQRSYVIDFGSNAMPESYIQMRKHNIYDFWKTNYGGSICNVFQTDSLISFKTTISGQNYFHFANRITHDVKNFQFFAFRTKYFFSIAQFVGASKDRFFFTVEPDELLRAYRNVKNKSFKKMAETSFANLIKSKDPVFASLLKDINIYSNQIIVSIPVSPNLLKDND